jgi:hypothetical protein
LAFYKPLVDSGWAVAELIHSNVVELVPACLPTDLDEGL